MGGFTLRQRQAWLAFYAVTEIRCRIPFQFWFAAVTTTVLFSDLQKSLPELVSGIGTLLRSVIDTYCRNASIYRRRRTLTICVIEVVFKVSYIHVTIVIFTNIIYYVVVLSRRISRRRCPLDGFAISITWDTVMHTSSFWTSRHRIFPPKQVRFNMWAHERHGREHFPRGCSIMSDALPDCQSFRAFA